MLLAALYRARAEGLLPKPVSAVVAAVAFLTLVSLITVAPPQIASDHVYRFTHLFAVALLTGVSIWTTIIFEITAVIVLPRHSFGLLQSKLFPRYFQVQVLSICTALLSYVTLKVRERDHKELRQAQLQALLLVAALFGALLNLLVAEPLTSKVMFQRHKLQKDEGASDEDIKQNTEYKRLSKVFGAFHGLSQLFNLVTWASALVHLWYIAGRVAL